MQSSYDLFKAAAARYPASVISFPDEGISYTYAEFLEEIDIYARALSCFGIGKGDRVAVFGQNSSYWMKCLFATFKTGAVAVPVGPKSVDDEILYIIATAGVKLLFHLSDRQISDKLMHGVPAIVTFADMGSFVSTGRSARQVQPACGDLQLIMFTSGTTANPKGVMLTPEGINNSVSDYSRRLKLSCDDVMLLNLPLSYCYGCVLVCCSFFLTGAGLVVSRRFTVRGTLRLIDRYRCTVLSMVPTMYSLLFSSGQMKMYDLSSVRLAMVGGSYTSAALLESMAEVFGREAVMCGYGMTECSSWAIAQDPDEPASLRGASAGRPVDNMEARIIPGYGDEDGETLQGELCLRGKGMMKGYLDAAMTAAAYDGEGWFHTGDVARLDAQGRYWIVDRCKDMIIKGGENISPKRIETVLDGYEGIDGAQVVGIRNDVYGEKIVAVLLRAQAEKTDIRSLAEYLKPRLGKNRRPDYYVAMDRIPETANGKVNKQAVRVAVEAKADELKRNRINYIS